MLAVHTSFQASLDIDHGRLDAFVNHYERLQQTYEVATVPEEAEVVNALPRRRTVPGHFGPDGGHPGSCKGG